MEFTFTADKVNKSTIRFAADKSSSPVTSLYVDNAWLESNGYEDLPKAVDNKVQVAHELKPVH